MRRKNQGTESTGSSLSVGPGKSRACRQAAPDLLTCAVCRYCNIKYQSWAGVSSNRNWKPAEVMQGGSPGSALETERAHGRGVQRKATIPPV